MTIPCKDCIMRGICKLVEQLEELERNNPVQDQSGLLEIKCHRHSPIDDCR